MILTAEMHMSVSMFDLFAFVARFQYVHHIFPRLRKKTKKPLIPDPWPPAPKH